ncbi:hypothetical protein ACQ4PT_004290 [Festuca glaucescens]
MCFEFGCFGGGRREDYGGEPPARKEPQGRGRRRSRGNGAADHKAPPAAYHNQPHAAAVDEAGHKAEYDIPKLPASHNKVGGNTGYTYAPAYTHTGRLHEAATDHKENAAMDYHHYPTATTNTNLVRY